jgi:hypothetical protein
VRALGRSAEAAAAGSKKSVRLVWKVLMRLVSEARIKPNKGSTSLFDGVLDLIQELLFADGCLRVVPLAKLEKVLGISLEKAGSFFSALGWETKFSQAGNKHLLQLGRKDPGNPFMLEIELVISIQSINSHGSGERVFGRRWVPCLAHVRADKRMQKRSSMFERTV